MIHIVGDSHSGTFNGANNVICHHLGAVTAFNLWKKHKTIKELLLLNPKDKYFFCVGEIDCRIHIYNKAIYSEVPEYFLVLSSVDIYVFYLSILKKNFDISVMAVPPQGTQNNVYGYDFYADRKKRQEITDEFNVWLEIKARDNKIPFVDVWYDMPEMRRPMFPESAFKEDACHIKNSIAIERLENWLEKKGLYSA